MCVRSICITGRVHGGISQTGDTKYMVQVRSGGGQEVLTTYKVLARGEASQAPHLGPLCGLSLRLFTGEGVGDLKYLHPLLTDHCTD